MQRTIVLFAVASFTLAAFTPGEKCFYDLAIELPEFGLSGKVGTIELEMIGTTNMRGTLLHHAVVRIRAADIIRPIFPFNNVFQSWFDASTFTPHRVVYQVRQGKWSNDITFDIDVEKRIGVYTDRRNPSGKKIHLPPRAMDVITALYALRRAPKDRPFDFIWLDYDRLRDEEFTFSEGTPMRMKPLRKDGTVSVLQTHEHIFYGFTVNLAKEFEFLPFDVNIPAVRSSRFTLVARARLAKYISGKLL
ncbi:MAG: DUF3108 domain-containing protein [Spirochaetota bacterium]